MSKITSAQRRALTNQLEREATGHGLALERRERTKGRWVWDVRDVERGTLAVRGVDLDQLGAYLAECSDTNPDTSLSTTQTNSTQQQPVDTRDSASVNGL
jgi:hypothetical protein